MPHTAQHLRSFAPHGAVISIAGSGLGRDLKDFYPEVVSIDEASPLGLFVRRLSQVLDAAEVRAERRFASELIAVVPDLRRYAPSRTGDATESEDLVQDTLLKAWEHRPGCRPGTGLKAWLFTILRDGHFNGQMKYRREVPDPEGSHAAGLASLADQEHRLDVQDVQEALARLEPARREALLLVAVEDLSYAAGSAWIGGPPGTMKTRDRLAVELGEA